MQMVLKELQDYKTTTISGRMIRIWGIDLR